MCNGHCGGVPGSAGVSPAEAQRRALQAVLASPHRNPAGAIVTATKVQSLPGDRDSLPYFAGRQAEIKDLGGKLDRVVEVGSTPAGIALITGMPGAGKSELGRQFVKRLADGGNVKHGRVSFDMLEGHVDLFLTIAAALGKTDAGRELTGHDTRIASGGGGVVGAKAQVTFDHARHAPESLLYLLAKSKEAGMWTGIDALVLMVDELQNARPKAMDSLNTLHLGEHGCPILLVGIGLQHTGHVLSGLGISRISNPIALGCLSHEETVDAIRGNLRAVGCDVDATVGEACIAALAKASFGFPQHIHAYLNAAVEVIQRQGRLDAEAALAETLAKGDAARNRYYDDRLNSMATRTPYDAIFPIVAALNDQGASAMRERAAIDAYADSAFDGEQVVGDAIAHGVLARLPKGMVGFGIPSFHSYMSEQLRALG